MTPPRQVRPGTVYLVTRRCAQREFLLKPSKRIDAIFKYLLAVASKRYGVQLHAACVMSNHYHLVLSDPRAQLPRFCQLLDGLAARVLNASYGRWESFWGPASYSAVELLSAKDVVEKAAYALANPVEAGLVAHGSEWPGIWTGPEQIGAGGEIVQRPELFFSKTGSMPACEALVFTVPKGFASAQEFRAVLAARLGQLEQAAAEALRAKGKRFMGAPRVRKQKYTERPASPEPRRGLNPRIAAQDSVERVEALARLAEFRGAYREALSRFRAGERRARFPHGTYLLRVHLGVVCCAA